MAAGSEGTRLVDMSRAVISSAMTMFLGNRPNYGDVKCLPNRLLLQIALKHAGSSDCDTGYVANQPPNNARQNKQGSVYWSVTAHDAGSLPLESFALNRALLLWGHPHEAASRVGYYLNMYVRNSSGLTPSNDAGMTRNTLWNSSGHGPPGSLDLKQWGCGHGPGGAV
eukprot:SAG11_NODE_7226_length_1175_cov_1.500929_2_plen_167_part_01